MSTGVEATRRRRARRVAVGLGLTLVVLAAASLLQGSTGQVNAQSVVRWLFAPFGLAEPLDPIDHTILGLRFYRTLVTIGVGAALALSGGLLQGVFRNALASPAVLGLTGGASLFVAIAILGLGGAAPSLMLASASGSAPLVLSIAALIGALSTATLVTALATSGGRVSVPTLLLVGVAVNAFVAGALNAVLAFSLRDFSLMRAILAWSFGTLADRAPYHVMLVFGGLIVSAAVIPFVARELDLFGGGEDDAQSLGVHPGRTKILALFAASCAAAVAVAAAGQIAFVGLVVPHLVRITTGTSHRTLLPLCLLGGPVLLLGIDVAQRAILGQDALQPGVMTSLVGGPFFLFLLVRQRKELRAW